MVIKIPKPHWVYRSMLSKIIKYIFFVYVAISLVVYIFYVPPFDKPDEHVHFLRAVSVARGNFICKVDKNNQTINFIPSSIYQFVEKNLEIRLGKIDEDKFQDSEDMGLINEVQSCVLPFFYYLITAIPILILTYLKLPLTIIFYSGRMINTIVSIAIIFYSLKGLPNNFRLISLYVLSWPMVLYQITSYSKDAYFLSLGLYIFNRFVYFVINKKIINRELILFLMALIFFVLTRPSYIFFTLFLIVFYSIRSQKISYLPKMMIGSGTIIVIFLAIFYLIFNKVYITPNNTNFALSYYAQIDPLLQLKFNLSHPIIFLQTLVNTIDHYFLFYVKSAIGIFGWLDKPLPNIVYGLFILIGGYLVWLIRRDKQTKLFNPWKGLLIGIIVLTVLTLFSTMYLYSSPVASPLIYGIQGRYFINLAPLLIIFLF